MVKSSLLDTACSWSVKYSHPPLEACVVEAGGMGFTKDSSGVVLYKALCVLIDGQAEMWSGLRASITGCGDMSASFKEYPSDASRTGNGLGLALRVSSIAGLIDVIIPFRFRVFEVSR